jgi:hypothetical protein
MATTLFALAVLFGVVLFWLDGARAREFATALVGELCQRRGLQLLDGTVALTRIAIRRTPQGLRFRRMFRFDFSAEGLGRRVGYVLLLGTVVERVIFNLPEDAGTEATPESARPESPPSNVVPLRRPRR